MPDTAKEPVGPTAALHGRDDADQKSERHGPDHGGDGEKQRRTEAVRHLVDHRTLRADRNPEVARHGLLYEEHELLGQGPVEPQALAHHPHRFLVGLGPGRELRGVAREQVHEEEDAHRHEEHGRHETEKTHHEIAKHRSYPFSLRRKARRPSGAALRHFTSSAS